MLSLSHTTGYAVLALACVGSWDGAWVHTEQIHKCTGVPRPYLRKLLNAMARAGLIYTKRGREGGVILARPANQITLMDVIEAVEADNARANCLLGLVGCSDANPCPMRGFWQKEQSRIKARLSRTTLADAARYVKGSHGVLTCCPNNSSQT